MPSNLIPEGCLQILLEIHAIGSEPADGLRRPIKYKEDGQRFGGSDITLKLSADHLYALTLVISPPSTITSPVMQGSSCPLEADNPASLTRKVEGASVHPFIWRCDAEISRDGTRHQLSLVLEVEGFGSIALPLQMKVYGDDLRGWEHVRQGPQSLLHLQYLLKKKSDKVALVGKVTAFGAFDQPHEKKEGARGGAFFLS